MNANETAADLANVHFNRKLDRIDRYINLAEAAYRLRDDAQSLLPPPHVLPGFSILDDTVRAGSGRGTMLLHLADREIAEYDDAMRHYGDRTFFPTDAAMIRDCRKRVEYLRAGKIYGIQTFEDDED